MLSRVAENLYWLARYVERAENTARLINVNTQLVLDMPKGITPGWEQLVNITGMVGTFTDCCVDADERNVVRFLIDHEANPNSIVTCLKQAKENCRTVREVLPRSAWELINELNIYTRDNARSGISKKGRDDYLNDIIDGSQRLGGLLGSVLYRDEGYHFVRIGRNLERSDMTTRILDVRSTDLFDDDLLETRTLDTLQWISVLKSMSGYQSYRRHVQIRVSRPAVLNYLLKNIQFPRSVIHCLGAVEESVASFVNTKKTLAKIRKTVKDTTGIKTDEISQADLHHKMDDIQLGIKEIHTALAQTYFM
jgi:uncharacterized alpha-E superfamily protein